MEGKDKRPFVSFFDHAIQSAELTEKSGRPRYIPKVYIQKIPSAPDLQVRDRFARAMTEQDKLDYPQEWALYQQRKGDIDSLVPPVTAIPGMDAAKRMELEALNIHNCRQLVDYEGNLDNLEETREIARRILEVANEIREGRDAVRDAADRQIHHPASVPGAGGGRKAKEEGNEKAGKQEEGYTFTFTQSWA